jgi:hypothetical protein
LRERSVAKDNRRRLCTSHKASVGGVGRFGEQIGLSRIRGTKGMREAKEIKQCKFRDKKDKALRLWGSGPKRRKVMWCGSRSNNTQGRSYTSNPDLKEE